MDKMWIYSQNALWWCTNIIGFNPLIYIFIAGFTGGIFSAMMQFKPLNQPPGDERYIFWYRITKPVIGAFGAMVLYIVVASPAFRGGIDDVINPDHAKILIKNPIGATGFAFGFLTGFTERIVLHKLH